MAATLTTPTAQDDAPSTYAAFAVDTDGHLRINHYSRDDAALATAAHWACMPHIIAVGHDVPNATLIAVHGRVSVVKAYTLAQLQEMSNRMTCGA
jgi:hypothetical protein